jgi:hypothetical protein
MTVSISTNFHRGCRVDAAGDNRETATNDRA